MKKIVKMSLVAAVAVAGITTANAKPLAEAIKDVDVSGTVVYRYNDYNNDAKESQSGDFTSNSYKIGINVSSKVNDDLKLNTRFIIGSDTNNGLLNVGGGTNGADGQVNVGLSQVYFSYTGLKNTTVNVGKQGLTTPWTIAIDADGEEQTGTGILALSTWGPATFIGGYFNQTNIDKSNGAFGGGSPITLDGSSDLYTAGIIGNVGPVTLDAWYLNSSEGASYDGFDSFTIGANGNFELAQDVKLGLDVRYTDLSIDTNNTYNKDNTFLDIQATLNAGIFNAIAVYGMTDEDGGLTAIDSSAPTTYSGWAMDVNGKADADLYMIGAGVQATEKLHIALNYTDIEWDNNGSLANGSVEEDEIYTQVTYKMSKNLSAYVRFGTYNYDNGNAANEIEGDYRGRLQVDYTF